MVAYLETQSVLELLNNFSNLSTVAYKGVAYKKIVYCISSCPQSNVKMICIIPDCLHICLSHPELKENMSRIGANLKHGIIEAVNRTWSSINEFARAHRSYDENNEEMDHVMDETESVISADGKRVIFAGSFHNL